MVERDVCRVVGQRRPSIGTPPAQQGA